MTPSARIAAAIDILDATLAGAPAEQTLTNWARRRRFAGSGDRAAIRDLVYDALRRRGGLATLGGALSGRGLMIGLARETGGDDLAALFSGVEHAPAPLDPAEVARLATPAPDAAARARLDWPDWLRDEVAADLGDDFDAVSRAMGLRAPVFLRVNLARATRADAVRELAAEGIEARPNPLAESALEVVAGARRLAACAAYRDGLVELQDASSQAAVDLVPRPTGGSVLDYCAGGGGKALALAAAEPTLRIAAHDADFARMRDLPARAARAGARIRLIRPGAEAGRFDVTLVDAPCSGSGTWRRAPDAKWRLDPDRLAALVALQARVLDAAVEHVLPGGTLVYMTCSLLRRENEAQIDAFLTRQGALGRPLALSRMRRFSPLDGGDGFFAAALTRA